MTHAELCARALKWLTGTMRCDPAFSGQASCDEIPDAIGWTSRYQFRGSIVVECKTSRSDFYADKKKVLFWKHPRFGYRVRRNHIPAEQLLSEGYEKVIAPRMGDFRFYMCPPGIITHPLLLEHAPDHGLLYVNGRKVQVITQAPRRTLVDYPAEIRYLRFAIIKSARQASVAQAKS